ncbi:MAG: transcriptional repressor [Oligoflexales bacterium]|nr:transcriptional repressor [Oligoflexales bacterium]
MVNKEAFQKWFWETLNAYLDKKQLKQTKQRKIIIDHFLRLEKHIDVEGLHDSLKRSGRNMGIATIYRTMNLLAEAGLVEQTTSSDGGASFEIRNPQDHHDHITCIKCGKVVEFKSEEIEKAQINVAQSHGFSLTSHRLDLFGYCTGCRKNSG